LCAANLADRILVFVQLEVNNGQRCMHFRQTGLKLRQLLEVAASLGELPVGQSLLSQRRIAIGFVLAVCRARRPQQHANSERHHPQPI
jgi:hypothetical protein